MKLTRLFNLFLCLSLLFVASNAFAQTTQPAPETEDTRKAAEEALKELETEESTLIIPETKKVKTTNTKTKVVVTNPKVSTLEKERRTVPVRSEGQFILNQQARLVATTNGQLPWQVTFEADKNGMADPPMYAIPSKLLEQMEAITKGKDNIVVVVTGQVFTYNNTNYLLLTKVKPVMATDNLEPGIAN